MELASVAAISRRASLCCAVSFSDFRDEEGITAVLFFVAGSGAGAVCAAGAAGSSTSKSRPQPLLRLGGGLFAGGGVCACGLATTVGATGSAAGVVGCCWVTDGSPMVIGSATPSSRKQNAFLHVVQRTARPTKTGLRG